MIKIYYFMFLTNKRILKLKKNRVCIWKDIFLLLVCHGVQHFPNPSLLYFHRNEQQ